jgi:hypothetical protein
MKHLLSSLLFICFVNITAAQTDTSSCEILHQGTFTYGSGESLVKVVIDGDKHTEYHDKGKYFIKSTIKWVSACEYNMTMTDISIPDFPYGVGDVMNVKIDKVVDQIIYYRSTVKNQTWNGTFIKVK